MDGIVRRLLHHDDILTHLTYCAGKEPGQIARRIAEINESDVRAVLSSSIEPAVRQVTSCERCNFADFLYNEIDGQIDEFY